MAEAQVHKVNNGSYRIGDFPDNMHTLMVTEFRAGEWRVYTNSGPPVHVAFDLAEALAWAQENYGTIAPRGHLFEKAMHKLLDAGVPDDQAVRTLMTGDNINKVLTLPIVTHTTREEDEDEVERFNLARNLFPVEQL